MNKPFLTSLSALLIASTVLSSCGVAENRTNERTEHYVSSQIEGEKQKINLEEVQKAFWDTQGKDFNSWMGAFEKRVNEIYEGDKVVSIDATRKTGSLVITGYIEDKKEQGYQDGEEKLFTIEQTGDVTDNNLPYRVAAHDGSTYYQGHHGILDNPFVQMMVLSHLMGGWGGRYNTPYNRTVILQDHRNTFRTTPGFEAQKSTNQRDSLVSKKKFGSNSFSSSSPGTQKRSWSGFGSSSSPSGSSSPSLWGGRRSSSSSGFGGGRSRGWGGRRR